MLKEQSRILDTQKMFSARREDNGSHEDFLPVGPCNSFEVYTFFKVDKVYEHIEIGQQVWCVQSLTVCQSSTL